MVLACGAVPNGPSAAEGGGDVAEPSPQARLVEVAKVEVPVELGCCLVDGVDDDCPGAELAPASHAPAKGIHEKVATESASLLGLIDRQSGQEHDGHRIGHPPSRPRRGTGMDDRAHRQRVVPDHLFAAAEHVGRGGAGGTGDVRRVPQPAVEICDTRFEPVDAMNESKPLD